MRVLGYGEDALTLHILRNHMGEFLKQLKDPGISESAAAYYRPSFGRGRGCFGEFDAIVSTERAIYLVETKWNESSEWKTGELKDKQQRRHEMFEWYAEQWQRVAPANWSEFATDECRRLFLKRFGKNMPHGKTGVLVRNLEFILQAIGARGKDIENVLLLVDVRGGNSEKPALTKVPRSFHQVYLRLESIGGAGFIQLQP
jgi:hypothetical protein